LNLSDEIEIEPPAPSKGVNQTRCTRVATSVCRDRSTI